MTRKRKVYSNQNVALVGSLQNYLTQHNIQAEIRNQYTSSVMGEVAFFDACPELWVAESDYERAVGLIEPLTKQADADGEPDWLCNTCREVNPANFEICWQCAKPH